MSALVLLICAALAPQDEARLKEAWPKLVEAWKSIEPAPPAAGVDPADEFLKTAAKLHEAFEAAGLFTDIGEYVPQAFKAFIKRRMRGGLGAGQTLHMRKALFVGGSVDPMQAFLDSMNRLKALERDGLDDEDNIQDELSTARKSLKALGITADATPAPLRRRVLTLARALASGDPYPEPARATEEQAAQIKTWIGALGHELIEEREKATRELRRMGEVVIPYLRDAAGGTDAEAVARVKQLLGFGHEPWKEVSAVVDRGPQELKLMLDRMRRARDK